MILGRTERTGTEPHLERIKQMAERGKTATITTDGMVLTFNYSDDTKATFDVAGLPPAILNALAVHGAKQKLADSYAGEKDLAVAKAGVTRIWDAFVAGEFSPGRESGPSVPSVSILALAWQRYVARTQKKDVPVEKFVARISSLSDAEKKALRKQVEVEFVAVQAERKAAEAATKAAKAEAEAEAEPIITFTLDE